MPPAPPERGLICQIGLGVLIYLLVKVCLRLELLIEEITCFNAAPSIVNWSGVRDNATILNDLNTHSMFYNEQFMMNNSLFPEKSNEHWIHFLGS